MIFWTADEHYYHKNIIHYCKRPYDSIDLMVDNIIEKHNSKVTENDIVYHLGDFSFTRGHKNNIIKKLIERLNGTHILILGNHDRFSSKKFIKMGFQSVHKSLMIEHLGYKIFMIHYPSKWNRISDIDPLPIFLHGHNHTIWKSIQDKNMVNVGVDVWNFYPVSFSEILKTLNLNERK